MCERNALHLTVKARGIQARCASELSLWILAKFVFKIGCDMPSEHRADFPDIKYAPVPLLKKKRVSRHLAMESVQCELQRSS